MDKDLIGQPASQDMRATPKRYGNNRMVGVIRNGKYVNPETGEPVEMSKEKKDFGIPMFNWIGGLE
jgi:hypothetical protein